MTERVDSIVKPWKKSIPQHLETVEDFAHQVIRNRRKEIEAGETDHRDLLSRFMKTHNEKGELLDDRELRDVVLNFVIAGRDTTAQALSWTFYMLLLHPRVENKLLEEIKMNIEDELMEEPAALYEAIKNMTYAHAV